MSDEFRPPYVICTGCGKARQLDRYEVDQRFANENIKKLKELLSFPNLTQKNIESLNTRLDGYIVEYFNLEVKKAELRDEIEKESEEDKNAVKQSNS